MILYEKARDQLIILLFSLSIFLSYVSYKIIEFRFLYLFIFFFLIIDHFKIKKISKNTFLCSFIALFIIFFISILFNFIIFNNVSFIKYINLQSSKEFIIKVFFQSSVIGISIIILSYYKKFIILNFYKFIDYFVIIFIISLFIFNLLKNNIISDLLFSCDNFFYVTKYLFTEGSHFSLISVPVITSFIYNYNIYLKQKLLFFAYILFILFSFGNFSLTFFLSSTCAIIIIFLTCGNLGKKKIFLYIFFLLINFFFISFDGAFYRINYHFNKNDYEIFYKYLNTTCISKASKISKKYKLNSNNMFGGSLSSDKKKLFSIANKNNLDLSTSIYIYSLHMFKESILNYPLGIGINNYKNYRNIIDKSYNITDNNYYKKNIEVKFHEKFKRSIPATVLQYNLNSGSNNLSKLGVEFGIFFIIYLIFIFISSFNQKLDNYFKVTLLPLLFSQIFIRGTGLFYSGFLICIIIITILSIFLFKKNENKN